MNKQKRLPYNVIVEAKKGDVVAMQKILRHYETYMNHFSKRPVRNGDGTHSNRIDLDVKEEIEAHLMRAIILHFNCKDMWKETESRNP